MIGSESPVDTAVTDAAVTDGPARPRPIVARSRGALRRGWTAVVEVYGDPLFQTCLRTCAIVVWVVLFIRQVHLYGVPFDREGILLWLATGAAAATVGRRNLFWVVVDWLPFAGVLIAYDYARGAADSLGMPTWWTPQITVDKALFGGIEPTVWLQQHLKYGSARWWDAVVCVTYFSFFFLPYVTAAVLWIRSRREFHRWALRFVTLSFAGFGLFALIPAAPPWAAARCTAAQVASHPSHPSCMGYRFAPDGGLLGPMNYAQHGANPWIERLSGKGWGMLHLHVASAVLTKGQAIVDQVAAVPSLHAGGTMLFALFLRERVNRWWRAALAVYIVVMAFALVYSAEHYVADILAGWALAALVHWGFGRFERRRKRGAPPDRVGEPAQPASDSATVWENECPPIATMPSST